MNTIKNGIIAIVCATVWTCTLFAASPAAMAASEYAGNSQKALFNEAELSQMLAPIALYPDSLLGHIMLAAHYPIQIVEAQRWRKKHLHLHGNDALERAATQSWHPSVLALVVFPDVLARLNDDLRWTQNIGHAYLMHEKELHAVIQKLRRQAERAHSFKEMANMRVVKINQLIVLESIHQNSVYVPYYDTRKVFGNWHWRKYPPVFWEYRPIARAYHDVYKGRHKRVVTSVPVKKRKSYRGEHHLYDTPRYNKPRYDERSHYKRSYDKRSYDKRRNKPRHEKPRYKKRYDKQRVK